MTHRANCPSFSALTRARLDALRAELSQLPWHFSRDAEGWLLAPIADVLTRMRVDGGDDAFYTATRSVLGPLHAHRRAHAAPQARLPSTDVAAVVAEIDRRAEHLASHQLAALLEDLLDTYEAEATIAHAA